MTRRGCAVTRWDATWCGAIDTVAKRQSEPLSRKKFLLFAFKIVRKDKFLRCRSGRSAADEVMSQFSEELLLELIWADSAPCTAEFKPRPTYSRKGGDRFSH
jgi:hypothetical protein